MSETPNEGQVRSNCVCGRDDILVLADGCLREHQTPDGLPCPNSGGWPAMVAESCRECRGAGWISTETGQAVIPGRADAEPCAFCDGSGVATRPGQ